MFFSKNRFLFFFIVTLCWPCWSTWKASRLLATFFLPFVWKGLNTHYQTAWEQVTSQHSFLLYFILVMTKTNSCNPQISSPAQSANQFISCILITAADLKFLLYIYSSLPQLFHFSAFITLFLSYRINHNKTNVTHLTCLKIQIFSVCPLMTTSKAVAVL